jgi:hypothetical protein
MKKSLATLAALSLALSLGLAADAEAGKKGRNIATGIIIGIGAATLFGAAAQAAADAEEYDSYGYIDDFNPRQNAVAACLHRAHRVLRQRGAEGTELRAVREAVPVGSASIRVSLSLWAYYDGDPDRVNVQCRVFRDRVTKISVRG